MVKKECISSEKRKKITIVLVAGNVGSVPKKHNWINYIFIFLPPFKSENMHFIVVLHPSGLYEKLQDYQDAFHAPLGVNVTFTKDFCRSDVLPPRKSYERENSKVPATKFELFY